MLEHSRKLKILESLALAGVLPTALGLSAHFFTTLQHESESLHACIEVSGGCISIAVALLLVARARRGDATHLFPCIAALVGMGMFDIAHGAWEYGTAWSWLRALGTAAGGTLFALVWFPLKSTPTWRPRFFIGGIALGAASMVTVVLVFRHHLPAMWTPSGGYTMWTKSLNSLGGLGFLAATLFFFRRFWRTGVNENLVFASHTLLLMVASLLIWFSRNWHLEWWLWHLLRLAAYGVVAIAAYEVVSQMQKQLLQQNAELEALVTARTGDLKRILDSSLDAIISMDAAGRIVEFNPAAERIFGHAAPAVIGRSLAEVIIPPRLRAAHERGLAHYLAKGEGPVLNQRLEMSALRSDGTEFAVELSINRIIGSEPPRFSGFLRDITNRKMADAALRESEERFRTLADNISQFAWMADASGSLFWYNQRWFDYTGTNLEEMLGWGWQKVHHAEHVTRVTEKFKRHIASGEIWEDTFPLRGRHGEYRWFLSRALPIRDAEGRVVRWFGTNTDVTELREAQAKVGEANALLANKAKELEILVEQRTAELRDTVQQLETFSYSIVHDMRAPLRSMSSFATFLNDDYRDKLDDTGRSYLDRITGSALRMDALITDVLNYSRLSGGDLRLARVELAPLVQEIVQQYPQFQEKADAIEVQIPLPAVAGNEALLTQILSNLLGNALKFVPATRAARVVVRAEQNAEHVRLWVEDNGIGIPSDQQEKIFGLFQRLHRTDEYAGTGVGLAIVKKAAERMEGRVGVESILGEGSRFWVELKKA